MTTNTNLNRETAKRVLEVVDAGLVSGLGAPEPGRMCVEAAVCFALGLPHSDNPPCVGAAVRSFKIRLNDSCWSSDEVRAKGLRKLAVAQLGSNTIDQTAFAQYVIEQTIRRILPLALRAVADGVNETYRKSLLAAADRCAAEGSTDAAADAAYVARDARLAACTVRAVDASRAVDAANVAYVTDAATVAAYAAICAARTAYAAWAAADTAARAAYVARDTYDVRTAEAVRIAYDAAHAYDAVDAARIANAADAVADAVLNVAAEIGLEALIQLKSPGCDWLDLCE